MNIRKISTMFLVAVCGGLVAIFVYARMIEKKSGLSLSPWASSFPYQLSSYEPYSIQDVSFPDLSFAAEKAVNCVVHVKTKSTVDTYRNFLDYIQGRRQQIPTEGFGSGVIISPDGYIITNNHVIRGADEIDVALSDRRVLTAKLIGADPATDLALLKVDEKDLPYLTFGDSETLRVGEWVLAVGNPFNLTSTVTAGIVSAKARYLGISSQRSRMEIESFIQTDAAVNQGNSGGALVNIRGELVGINTLIVSPTRGFSGSSFAIPATIVQKVATDLKEFGVVQRALLGADFQRRSDDNFDNEKEELYVISVMEDGGAAAAGIKVGDVITAINDVNISTQAEYDEQISKYRPNDNVKISLIRDKKTQHFNVTLRNIEGTTQILRADNSNVALGATFEQVSQRERQELGIRSGVKVKDVGQGRLYNLGVRNGFIITSINDRPVNTAKDIRDAIDAVDAGGRVNINSVDARGRVSYFVFAK